MKHSKQTLAFLLAIVLLLTTVCGCSAPTQQADPAEQAMKETADLLLKTVTDPTVASVGGEWAVLGLARWGGEVPAAWFERYFNNLQTAVTQAQGVLHARKYTEYSRAVLAVTALGKDPADVAGYDLLRPLANFDQTVWQGVNGAVWALIALDSGDWELPVEENVPVQATRALYVQHILSLQHADGGWSLSEKGSSQSDLTAMALQALASYRNQPNVSAAIERALSWLAQNRPETCEGAAQLVVALGELGVSLTDSRFAPEGGSVTDLLLEYYRAGEGFLHEKEDAGVNQMSTEQAFYALVSASRQKAGKSSLYHMNAGTAMQTGGASGAAPAPENASVIPGASGICTVSITCNTLLENQDLLNKDKRELVPADGVILPATQVSFEAGETVFDILQRVTREKKIHMEYVDTPLYDSAYIEGIANLYEFDAGNLSGWNYRVNDWFPNYGCSQYILQDGDVVEWMYTCDLGKDIGNEHLDREVP